MWNQSDGYMNNYQFIQTYTQKYCIATIMTI